jgi:aspartate/tyrosine/aromatic aminotransferase
LDLNAWLDTLGSQGKPGDVVCLHACCHNPTGIDPTPEQWSEVAKLLAERGMIPLVDFAYQGFGEGLVEDRRSIEELVKYHDELFVCTSFSKNFGLYSERVGALMVISADDQVAERVESRIKQAVRSNYSNPPRHGAAIVATILADAELREVWVEELNSMRERIQDMRIKFVDAMKGTGCDTDFSFLLGQRGMFSYSGLTPLQVDWLRKEKGIYIVGSGRINVAGITAANLDELTAAIAESLRV